MTTERESDAAAGDFRPIASWKNLRLRADLLRRMREFFHERGFLEVETPLLSADVVVDRHLDPVSVVLPDDPRQPHIGLHLWLQTSPEFAMKRLLAAGGPDAPAAIYQITHAFRGGEAGELHNPEFTIVEWYRTGDDMQAGMQLLSDLCEALLERGPAEPISYRSAFQKHLGLDPHTASIADLQAAATTIGISAPASLGSDRDGWLDLLLSQRIQPHLGHARPAILFDYPASQAALARTRAADAATGQPAVGQRFELYVDGIELANGYHELLDPEELRRRQAEANAARRADCRPVLPENNRLLAAMESGLPQSTGVALGFDRLAMIAAAARAIQEILPFPIDRA
jgi:elongation factor P--(R)-beta-lysine ligase